MKNSIIFHNRGELDMRGVTTFGLSVKKTDSPIGYFGTGLKYAIAVLLREGCEIEICSGENKYKFHSEKDSFRGEECDLIFMTSKKGKPLQLPFTLALGRNWEIWQAYRELYCNALDEGGVVCDKHKKAKGKKDFTFVVVRGEKFIEAHKAKDSFINSDSPIIVAEQFDIVPTAGVYLKGIKISYSIYYRPVFGYNFHSGISLTEDRTLKHDFEAEAIIKRGVLKSSDHDVISSILTATEGSFEEQISWSNCSVSDVGETFKRAVLNLAEHQPDKISTSAKDLAKKLAPHETLRPYIPTEAQFKAFDKACRFLARRGVLISDYQTKFVATLGKNIWGQAKQGEILIAAGCFDYGIKCLVATLYEEHLHLKTGMEDCTRDMQNHLFHTIVGLWEESDGECL